MILHDEFIRRRSEFLAHDVEGDAPDASNKLAAEDNTMFLEVIGAQNKKCRVYGLGQLGDEFIASSSQAHSVDVSSTQQENIIANLREQLQEKDTRIERIELDLQQTRNLLTRVVSHLGLSPVTVISTAHDEDRTDPPTGPTTDPPTGPMTDPATGPTTDPAIGPATDIPPP